MAVAMFSPFEFLFAERAPFYGSYCDPIAPWRETIILAGHWTPISRPLIVTNTGRRTKFGAASASAIRLGMDRRRCAGALDEPAAGHIGQLTKLKPRATKSATSRQTRTSAIA